MNKSLPRLLALVTLVSIGISQGKKLPLDLDSLVEAERAFARTSVEKGVRASFTEFFADDGLNFRPAPVNVKEDYRNRPAPPGPQPFTLDWKPIFADISQAGDLGYTTGPIVITDQRPDRKPTSYSYYFSVWQKQSAGDWKVKLDFGTSTPDSVDVTRDVSFKAGLSSGWKLGKTIPNLENERAGLLKLEQELSKDSMSKGIAEAYRQYLMDYARLHRDNLVPLVDKDAILSFLTGKGSSSFLFEPIDAGIASSADLGYTYGKYERVEQATPKPILEKGYFLRVWKRDSVGKWRIVADIASAVPNS
ncbi:MAG TPA: nuclear transport factor 2 family protein [Pyrinomonadaceae bacterium]|nr:nuclear transport factor 2 family protein [Pyrinomonadaceae bacterium]